MTKSKQNTRTQIDWASWLAQARRMSALLSAELERFRLTLGAYEILMTLTHGPLPQAAVCERTDHSEPSVSRWLQQLEIEGWIIREHAQRDRRRFVVSITDSGKKHLNTAQHGLVAVSADLHLELSFAEWRCLHRRTEQFLRRRDDGETEAVAARAFGTEFGAFMTRMTYFDGAWQTPLTGPLQPLSLHPGTHALHYASQGFEGMKAFRQPNGAVKIFRLSDHVARFRRTAAGLHLPVPPEDAVAEMIRTVVHENAAMVPAPPATLYLRPTIIGSDANIGAVTRPSESALVFVIVSPVISYFAASTGPLRLLIADEERAVAGIGATKAGANYASALTPIVEARISVNADQVLFCPRGDVQETGTSNFILINDNELVTKPLDRSFLPGITRDSLLRLAANLGYAVNERNINVDELAILVQSSEAALTGTAAVVAPVGEIIIDGHTHHVQQGENVARLRKALTDIQFGLASDPNGWLSEPV